MKPDTSRTDLFEVWAAGYDKSVSTGEEFPFNGYEQLLDTVCEQAQLSAGQLVLDLGTGTGNLVGRLLKSDCKIWGTDFSTAMLVKAGEKYPQVHFIVTDLLQGWSPKLPSRFDKIVSTYVFHEFDLNSKISLLQTLTGEHLQPDGWLVIGDISFPASEIREQASARWHNRWDQEEHYWAADEIMASCCEAGLGVLYTQVSSCAGVYKVRPQL